MILENDCEDQGFSRISDGCLLFKCQTWKGLGNSAKPVHPKLEKRERLGKWWWTCPKCGGSYGEAKP